MLPFALTSHARKWVVSAERLREQRAAATERAARLVSKAREVGGEAVEALSCEEERLLVCQFLTIELPQRCAHERVDADERMQMLAALCCLRVHARHSLMELVGGGCLDPRVSMATCRLVAAKIEEAKDLDAAVLESAAHVGRPLILALEPDALALLDRDLCAHLPAVALDGLLSKLDDERSAVPPRAPPRAPPAVKVEPGIAGAAADDSGAVRLRAACAAHVLGPARRADGLLTHSPQQLALAAFCATSRRRGRRGARGWPRSSTAIWTGCATAARRRSSRSARCSARPRRRRPLARRSWRGARGCTTGSSSATSGASCPRRRQRRTAVRAASGGSAPTARSETSRRPPTRRARRSTSSPRSSHAVTEIWKRLYHVMSARAEIARALSINTVAAFWHTSTLHDVWR